MVFVRTFLLGLHPSDHFSVRVDIDVAIKPRSIRLGRFLRGKEYER